MNFWLSIDLLHLFRMNFIAYNVCIIFHSNRYRGSHCQTDINECASNPCKYGATCTQGKDFYECNCVPGYNGTNCEINIDDCASQPCRNGGQCIDGVNRFICHCQPPYAGRTCETELTPCLHHSCQNGATCVPTASYQNYTCTCRMGYKGELSIFLSLCTEFDVWIVILPTGFTRNFWKAGSLGPKLGCLEIVYLLKTEPWFLYLLFIWNIPSVTRSRFERQYYTPVFCHCQNVISKKKNSQIVYEE